jgi:hypothetical protein
MSMRLELIGFIEIGDKRFPGFTPGFVSIPGIPIISTDWMKPGRWREYKKRM